MKIVIFGVGLIGGSFALALKQVKLAKKIVGVSRTQASIQSALDLGAIDAIGAADAATLSDADLVLLAMPVGQMGEVMARIAPHLSNQTIITDAGSTKQDVVALAYQHLGACIAHFVPAHPIAGGEVSGVSAAHTDLYRHKKVVITPLKENAATTVEKVRAIWQACGAEVREMPAAQHDAVFAAVSHLPHLLAYALVHDIANRPDAELMFDFAAGGFRDFTRIAGSHPEMWRDISLANRDALLREIDTYMSEVSALRKMVEQRDAEALEKLFEFARDARSAWLAKLKS
ncbi:MAG: prephenate dehydrogenase/arogenate dehydrogenase family protein [Burkholderiales bacterium]